MNLHICKVLTLLIMLSGSLPVEIRAESVPVSTENKPKKILFLGDSISVGIGASHAKKRYTTLVADTLGQGKVKIEEVNVAISGSTLVDQLWPEPKSSGYPYVLKKAIEAKPDIFVIQHGTNDNAVGASIGEFLWSYRQTVRAIKKNLPKTKIVCMTICPSWGVTNATTEWLNQANIGIQEIAASENTLLAHTNFKLQNRCDLFPDGIHPNDEGHQIMAESVIEALQTDNVKSKGKFDFICHNIGQQRICGYVFDLKSEGSSPKEGWIYFRDVQKDGFTYISDFPVQITTPFKLYDKVFIAKATSKDADKVEIKGHWDHYRGCGIFSLPQTNSKEIIVKIDW
jgi:lysophospholipase L1-like esterase